MKERQCRICGEWKSIEKHFSYSSNKKLYWCKSCCDIYNSKSKINENAIPWIRKEQKKWDYIPRKVNNDRLPSK